MVTVHDCPPPKRILVRPSNEKTIVRLASVSVSDRLTNVTGCHFCRRDAQSAISLTSSASGSYNRIGFVVRPFIFTIALSCSTAEFTVMELYD